MFPLTSLVGRPVQSTKQASWQETVRDIEVDVTREPVVVTGLMVGEQKSSHIVAFRDLTIDGSDAALLWIGEEHHGHPTSTGHEVLLLRDLLDGRVYDAANRRTARVAEVWLDTRDDPKRVEVAGVEVGPRAAFARLRPRRHEPPTAPAGELLRLSELHLMTPHGHRVLLADDSSAAHRLTDIDLAHLLTHLPPSQATEVAQRVPGGRLERAFTRLHPHVRRKLQRAIDQDRSVRKPRTRRTEGWRLYLPRERDSGHR
jgi:hypothetical protein